MSSSTVPHRTARDIGMSVAVDVVLVLEDSTSVLWVSSDPLHGSRATHIHSGTVISSTLLLGVEETPR